MLILSTYTLIFTLHLILLIPHLLLFFCLHYFAEHDLKVVPSLQRLFVWCITWHLCPVYCSVCKCKQWKKDWNAAWFWHTYVLWFYAGIRMLRLREPLLATVQHQQKIRDLKLNDTARRAVLDIKDQVFWKTLYALLRAVFPAL